MRIFTLFMGLLACISCNSEEYRYVEPGLNFQIETILEDGTPVSVNMSIYFVLFFGALAVLPYLSAEVDNPSLKFIGGCFMIVLLFARYFFNSMQRKAI